MDFKKAMETIREKDRKLASNQARIWWDEYGGKFTVEKLAEIFLILMLGTRLGAQDGAKEYYSKKIAGLEKRIKNYQLYFKLRNINLEKEQ